MVSWNHYDLKYALDAKSFHISQPRLSLTLLKPKEIYQLISPSAYLARACAKPELPQNFAPKPFDRKI